jgi:hypothetical protein
MFGQEQGLPDGRAIWRGRLFFALFGTKGVDAERRGMSSLRENVTAKPSPFALARIRFAPVFASEGRRRVVPLVPCEWGSSHTMAKWSPGKISSKKGEARHTFLARLVL